MIQIDAVSKAAHTERMHHHSHWARRGAAILFLCSLGLSLASCIALSTVDSGGTGGAGGNGQASSSSGPDFSSSSSGLSSSSSSGPSSSSSSSASGASSSSSSSSSSSGQTAGCGDAVLGPGEECDDGNTAEGDGCAIDCKVEHPEVCPGTAIHLAPGDSVTASGNTAGASDKFVGSSAAGVGNCANGSFTGPDWVYGVMPSANGTLTVTLDSKYTNSYVHVRSECPGTPAQQVGCYYRMTAGTSQISFAVMADTTYYVAADSFSNSSGAFTLTLTLQ